MLLQRILLCTDFSDNSVPAREHAVMFAAEFGADLFILHVIDSSQIGYPSLDEGVPVDIKSALDGIQQSVDKALAIIAEDCCRELPAAKTFSRIGTPSYEIVKFADEQRVHMIVMGTHGRRGFRHLVMGSTAENVVRMANCPVLTVRSTSSST